MNVNARLKLVLGLTAFTLVSACDWLGPDKPLTPGPAVSQFIVHCKVTRCSQLEPVLAQNNARIDQYFDNFPLLAVSVPTGSTGALRRSLGSNPLYKDKPVPAPVPVKTSSVNNTSATQSLWVDRLKLDNNRLTIGSRLLGVGRTTRAADLIQVRDDDEDDDDDYDDDNTPPRQPPSPPPVPTDPPASPAIQSFNLFNTGIEQIQPDASGQNIVVAVIDSGVANDPAVVPVLDGSIIGGENFVPGALEPSATSILNSEHGTWVGHLIAGHGDLILPVDSPIATTIALYRPDSIIQLASGEWQISMQGMAPEAKIYAMKTFPADGAGAPSSRVIAAMDRVLSLKTSFNDGLLSVPIDGDGSAENPFVYDALDIRVVNLSLGGSTLFAGQEIDELMTEALLAAGVVVVTSAGNEGFIGLSTGAPGTGLGALSVGATSLGANEQVFRELANGVGMGALFRPDQSLQIAHFSSRGPTADGRQSVHVLANGVATFVQGADGHLSMVSGTSFSAPIVSGAAAALFSAVPTATAAAVRAAIAGGADASALPAASPIDQGYGVLNVPQALSLLSAQPDITRSDLFPDAITAAAGSKVTDLLTDSGFTINTGPTHTLSVTLTPAEVAQFWLEVPDNTASVVVQIDAVTPALPLDQQNSLFGDDVIIEVADGPTSTDHLVARAFLNQAGSFLIADPVAGVMRVALMGDWTNIGNVDISLSIELLAGEIPPTSYAANITEDVSHTFEFDVTDTTGSFALRLNWPNGWNWYPAHDIDLILISPSGLINADAATLHAPEYVQIDAAEPGTWMAIVEGFSLHGGNEQYELLLANAQLRPIDAPPSLLTTDSKFTQVVDLTRTR